MLKDVMAALKPHVTNGTLASRQSHIDAFVDVLMLNDKDFVAAWSL
jgi:hypothetical protein